MTTISNQQLMERQPINYQLYQQTNSTGSHSSDGMKEETAQAKNLETNVYPKNFGVNIDYEEYMEYCNRNAVAPDLSRGKTVVQKSENSAAVQPLHIGRAMNTYAKASLPAFEGKIDSEV